MIWNRWGLQNPHFACLFQKRERGKLGQLFDGKGKLCRKNQVRTWMKTQPPDRLALLGINYVSEVAFIPKSNAFTIAASSVGSKKLLCIK